MKVLAWVMAILAVIYFLPAFTVRTDEINGHSQKTALKSARDIKRYLNTDDRVLFDTAFGILYKIKSRDGEQAFLDAVDGQGADQIIELAKTEVNVQIAAGNPEFKPYQSWDDMLQKLTKDTSKKHIDPQSAPPLRNSSREGRPD